MLRYNFKYSSETIDNMMPWEMDIELSLILDSLQKEIQSKSDASYTG